MRVTQNLLFQNYRRNLQTSERLLLDSQEKMASQKKINRASDDALASSLSQEARGALTVVEQFDRNIGRANSTINITETYLSQMEDLVSRAKELMLSQANTATSTPTTRDGVALELMSLRSQLLTLANSRLNGQYVFAGTDNATPPFAGASVAVADNPANTGDAVATARVADDGLLTGDVYQVRFTGPGVFEVLNATTGAIVTTDGAYVSGQAFVVDGVEITIADGATPPAAGDVFDLVTFRAGAYSGNSGEIKIEIEADNFLSLNISGDRLFQGDGVDNGVNLFEVFNSAIHALRADDTAGLDTALEQFDTAKTQVSEFRSAMGARQNMLSTTEGRIRSRILDLNVERSFLEDIDLTEAATEFNRRDTAYKATLSVTSYIGQVSLLDFLR